MNNNRKVASLEAGDAAIDSQREIAGVATPNLRTEADRIERRIELLAFLRESNAIEGIYRKPTKAEIRATEEFFALSQPGYLDVAALVSVYQPGAQLRDRAGMNVRVGRFVPPAGGLSILGGLQSILRDLTDCDPWTNHVRYELLHPFTDGNGRSGRALWAWQMLRKQGGLPLGFLHQFYYQTLEIRGLNS